VLSVNTNLGALQALSAYNSAASQLAAAERRVSTGLAVASTRDDGAAFSIAQRMRAQAGAWDTVAQSLSRAQSIDDVAAAGAGQISDTLNEIQTQALRLTDETLGVSSQASILANIQQLVQQIDQTAQAASFGGVDLLVPIVDPTVPLAAPSGGPSPNLDFSTPMDGRPGLIEADFWLYNAPPSNGGTLTVTGVQSDATYTLAGAPLPGEKSLDWGDLPYGDWTDFTAQNPAIVSFDLTANRYPAPSPASYGASVAQLDLVPFRTNVAVTESPDGGSEPLYYHPMTSAWLGLSDVASMSTDQLLSTISAAISEANANAERIGSQQSLLARQLIQAGAMQDAITTGVGNLVDANLAQESAKLQADQARQQLALSSLSIANATPQMLLGLFR